MDGFPPYHACAHTHTFFTKPSLIDFKGVARRHQGTVAVITQRLHGCYIDDDTLAVKECHAQRNVGVAHPHAVALVGVKNKEHGVVGGQRKAMHESLLAFGRRVGNLSVKNMGVNVQRHAGIAHCQQGEPKKCHAMRRGYCILQVVLYSAAHVAAMELRLMELFMSSPLWAQSTAAPPPPGLLDLLMPFMLIMLVFYFLLIRPQQKRLKEHQELLARLKKGDVVVTAGGLIVTVIKVRDTDVQVKLGDDVTVAIVKDSITSIHGGGQKP